MNKLYDCCVIGGGPAGSSVATILAKGGLSVLVLEKEKFPREHVGESLLPFCYQIFEELGVLEYMKEHFSRKPGVTFSNIDGSNASHWCFNNVINDESSLSFHVRRAQFDQMLLENSKKYGAEVMEEINVKYIDFDANPDQVLIQAENENKSEITFTTRFVIDCSGQSTMLARQMGSKKAFKSLHRRVAYSTHWQNANWSPELQQGNIKIVHLEGEKLGWLWMIPLKEDRLSMGVALNMDYSKQQQKVLSKQHDNWLEALYLQELNSSPVAAEVIRGAQMIMPLAINGDFSYYTEKKFGDRFAIIGDASAFLDPIFSSGIFLAIKSAVLVGNGILQQFAEGKNEITTKAYEDISGAYRLVERLINTFYEPGSIKFSEADSLYDLSYEKFEAAYSIYHFVLAGDFFSNYDKYLKAIEMLRNPDNVKKYRNLVGHSATNQFKELCTLPENIMPMGQR